MSCFYCPHCGQWHQPPACRPVISVYTLTDAERIAALERRVAELEQRDLAWRAARKAERLKANPPSKAEVKEWAQRLGEEAADLDLGDF